MNKRLAIAGIAVIVLGIVLYSSLFTVSQTEQALVLQFGNPVRTVQNNPGLHVKTPFIQDVIYYEARVLEVDPPVQQVILADQRRLDVDSFARYRIADPLQFYQTVRDEVVARQRLATFVNAALRRVLGNVTQLQLLSEERSSIMNRITAEVSAEAAPLGIQIVDVRIGRADVPEGTVQSVYERMRSEREREAAEFRAQGYEQAQQIRARADRERTVLLAEAQRDSEILRGEGDGQAIQISAEAYGQDPEFFSFFRSLQAYREALRTDSTFVLSPTGDFFRYFAGSGVSAPAAGAGGDAAPNGGAAAQQPQAAAPVAPQAPRAAAVAGSPVVAGPRVAVQPAEGLTPAPSGDGGNPAPEAGAAPVAETGQ